MQQITVHTRPYGTHVSYITAKYTHRVVFRIDCAEFQTPLPESVNVNNFVLWHFGTKARVDYPSED